MYFRPVVLKVDRGTHQVSKGPQENDGKLEDHNKFLSEANETSLQEWNISNMTPNQEYPFSPSSSTAQKMKLYFIAFATSYLVQSGFSQMIYLLSNVGYWPDVVKSDDIHLSLTTL